ncbi:MAG: beta-ketoacyl synthase N-terminal-like domain-containing protein, partial [Microcoleaceae cyanobacterium]
MNKFKCFGVFPAGLENPNLAIVTNKAGGIGILDREFCQAEKLDQASKNLDRLLVETQNSSAVGLRLRVDQIDNNKLLSKLSSVPHWLILCGWNISSLRKAIIDIPPADSRQLLIEVLTIEQVKALQETQIQFDGWIAKGHESGGWVGPDSALILTQKLLKISTQPIYVQGGIGVHTAAACRAAGAAGVVLDDQLWLMPESPLPQDVQSHLKRLNGQEAMVIGERLQVGCRVLSRPGFKVTETLKQLADRIEVETEASDPLQKMQTWQEEAGKWVGWEQPDRLAIPMGQAVGMAVECYTRYQTTGGLVRALLQSSEEQIQLAKTFKPLAPNSPLAESHRTQYPIVQGPMTRVSDQASFAQAIAQAGALPMLALALMRGPQVRSLLEQVQTLMADRSWGIGILGFVPQALRQEQLAVVQEIKPPFALIAGGRPDQAAHLEAEGIATYIHVPTPGLLKLFLEQGAKRFVFEGRECGGHVGPLSSFVLWETTIATLLQVIPDEAASDIHILFAGGIHDNCSAAMVSAMAAPLVARGIKIGVLMGSAYIFTEEAVSSGAIASGFQAQILNCQQTINLETGPGHSSRCAMSSFAQEFYETRRQMIAAAYSPDEVKETLEKLTLGRLRIASKGLKRNEAGELIAVNSEQQVREGMYMIGQVATLREKVCTLRELHQDVSEVSTARLNEVKDSFEQPLQNPHPQKSDSDFTCKPSDIAIIGISTLLPKAQYPNQFWDNLLRQVNAITEIPNSRWDWRLYYDSNRNARDKVYSKWGGFLEDVPFDPLKFGIPPNSLKSIEPLQLLTLEAVRRALEDAGYANRNFDRENTSVILGAGGGIADLGQQYATRSELPRFVGEVSEQTRERLPEWTEESFPGLLLNVIAGRVTNRFNFGGSNFTVDAACASSLAAIDLAVQQLETGRCNVAIAGGVDTCQSPFAYLCFSKTQALSPQGQARTFDREADGIVISEGIAIVVLKRLADAERDKDRIYGIIKAVAGSSDGKALGLTAPHSTGQLRAVDRAYRKAGFSQNTLALYEAHGTGTVAGDRAELETLLQTLVTNQAGPNSCAIGSVKTLIGHTKSTAGVTGLIKATLSLYHKVLPPHSGVEHPLDSISDPNSPVYLLKQPHPWLKHPEYPRRAAVSSFGFGGTNFHAILEEYQGTPPEKESQARNRWPCELFLWRANDREQLLQKLQQLQQAINAGAKPQLEDLSYTLMREAQNDQNAPVCLAIVAEDLNHLNTSISQTIEHLNQKKSTPLPLHIQINWQVNPNQDAIAFLFPGQGAQYPDMARELALYFPEMRQMLEFADRYLYSHFPQRLSQFIYPPSPYSDEEDDRNHQALTNTDIAQPAIGTLEMGFLQIADRLGLQADMVAGHSYGEYTALYAAGVLSESDLLRLSEIRGRTMATACDEMPGAMAVVRATREDLLTHLKGFAGVVVANHNAPLQSVISGSRAAVEAVVSYLNRIDIKARLLPVAGAFHTCLVARAQTPLAEAIAATDLQPPKIPVYANSTAQPYSLETDAIRDLLSKHLLGSVEYVSQIKAMYEKGARVFIELGPKSILTKLNSQNLADKPHVAVSFDGHGGGLRGFLIALGNLVTQGVRVKLMSLFDNRNVRELDLSGLVEQTQKPPLPKTAWLLNGGSIRTQTETIGYAGKLPPFNQDNQPVLQPHPIALTNQSKILNGTTQTITQDRAHSPESKSMEHQPTSEVNSMTHSTVNHSNNNYSNNETSQPIAYRSLTPDATSSPLKSTLANPQPTQPSQGFNVTSERLAAYQAYQETMRQFLNLQEQVMYQFLSGTQAQPLATPVLSAPKHNISQVSSPTISSPKPTLVSDFSGEVKSYSTQQLPMEPEVKRDV